MNKETEIRMIENYQIEQAINIGGKEVVLGVDTNNELPFIVCFCSSNNDFGIELRTDVIGTDNYLEAMHVFTERVQKQIELTVKEREKISVEMKRITIKDCIPDKYDKNIEGKVIVINPEVMRYECQTADRQLWLCTGGFGAHENSRGSACFCTNLYTGEYARWERHDVLGEINPDRMPEWAKDAPEKLQLKKDKKAIEREER